MYVMLRYGCKGVAIERSGDPSRRIRVVPVWPHPGIRYLPRRANVPRVGASDRPALVKKYCFLNRERPCDLTCKAAFEVDDPVDNVDCYFIWLAHHFGEGLFEVRRILENMGGGAALGGSAPGPQGGGAPGRSPKGHSDN
jgi:hypothetical protein